MTCRKNSNNFGSHARALELLLLVRSVTFFFFLSQAQAEGSGFRCAYPREGILDVLKRGSTIRVLTLWHRKAPTTKRTPSPPGFYWNTRTELGPISPRSWTLLILERGHRSWIERSNKWTDGTTNKQQKYKHFLSLSGLDLPKKWQGMIENRKQSDKGC